MGILIAVAPSDIDNRANPRAALLAAAAAGSYNDTRSLLQQGVEPSVRDSKLRTPLHLAARNGDKDTIELLLKYKNTGWFADNNVTPLHLAAKYGNTGAVRQIASLDGHNWPRERATDPSAMTKIKKSTNGKFDRRLGSFFARKTFSARELAVIYGHRDTAVAFPSADNDDLLHAFSCACMLGDVHMVETLWDHNERRWYFQKHIRPLDPVRWFPAPPLHLAVMSRNRATVAILLERGMKVDDESSRSVVGMFTAALPPYSTPAHYAAMVGSTELLLMLEQKGADLTAFDHLSRTPLSYAVEELNVSAVKLLIKRKYPKHLLYFNSTYLRYFGLGHVWHEETTKTASRYRRIRKLLTEIGFSFEE
jgi:ankyrin repeat protein